jgi:hypothetical protein
MTLDLDKIQKRLDNKLSEFSGRFMSDSKWTKLFKALSQNKGIVKRCLIKNVLDNTLREIEIPLMEKFGGTFNDKGIEDIMTGGPTSFKEIEWVEFSSHWTIDRNMRTEKLEPHKYQQDISKIKTVADTVGQLVTVLDDDKLIIYGYRL